MILRNGSDNMIYFDYSATTPVNDTVLETFVKASKELFYNPNSLYPEAKKTSDLIEKTSERIKAHLHLPNHEVIYLSGASEANNLAIKGVAYKNQTLGKHLIMSPFEHSSVSACFGYLQKQGFLVDVVKTLNNGLVDLDDLKSLMREDTILVSICGVSSELGIVQPIEEISQIVHQYPNATFHSDMTQAIGKTAVKLDFVDLISMSAHKIYGLKGIGALFRRENVKMIPLIHGGKSTSKLRSGTPPTPLILSLEKAIDIATSELPKNYITLQKYHNLLLFGLEDLPGVSVNSPLGSIPHITNISVMAMQAKDMQAYLAENDVYVSTQTACSSDDSRSEVVYRLTKSETKARTSIRISLSHLTTVEEIERLVDLIRAVAI